MLKKQPYFLHRLKPDKCIFMKSNQPCASLLLFFFSLQPWCIIPPSLYTLTVLWRWRAENQCNLSQLSLQSIFFLCDRWAMHTFTLFLAALIKKPWFLCAISTCVEMVTCTLCLSTKTSRRKMSLSCLKVNMIILSLQTQFLFSAQFECDALFSPCPSLLAQKPQSTLWKTNHLLSGLFNFLVCFGIWISCCCVPWQ